MRHSEEVKDRAMKPSDLPCECWEPKQVGKTPDGTLWEKCKQCGTLLARVAESLTWVKTHWAYYDGDGKFRFVRKTDREIERERENESLSCVNKPDGKPRPSLVDAGFIMAMAEVMEAGLKGGRNREDWQRVERQQAIEEYRDALLRHAFGQGPEDERQHLAAVACNAMILWWHLGRE